MTNKGYQIRCSRTLIQSLTSRERGFATKTATNIRAECTGEHAGRCDNIAACR